MKKLGNFSNNIFQSFITFIRIIIFSRKTNISKILEKKKLLIIANGPSVNSIFKNKNILNQISKIDTLCVNYFFKSQYFQIIRPNYYLISAPEIWEDNIGKTHRKNREELFEHLINEVSWKMAFIVPLESKKYLTWQKKLNTNKNINIEFYNSTVIEGFSTINTLFYNFKLGMPKSHNVVGYALMTMIWKGYSEIGLIGVDHGWTKTLFVTEKNEAFLSQPHFYDENAKPDKMNKTVDENQKRHLHEIIHKFYLAFKSYFEINRYAQIKNVTIYNLTTGSFIDAFKRVTIEEFLN